jgi:hypothetical protein
MVVVPFVVENQGGEGDGQDDDEQDPAQLVLPADAASNPGG